MMKMILTILMVMILTACGSERGTSNSEGDFLPNDFSLNDSLLNSDRVLGFNIEYSRDYSAEPSLKESNVADALMEFKSADSLSLIHDDCKPVIIYQSMGDNLIRSSLQQLNQTSDWQITSRAPAPGQACPADDVIVNHTFLLCLSDIELKDAKLFSNKINDPNWICDET